jgi:hypothetical protein
MNSNKYSRRPLFYSMAILAVGLVLAACEKKSDTTVSSGAGASSEAVLTIQGAPR